MRITAPAPDHDQIGGVGSDDHHNIQHAIDSGLVHTGVITNTQHGVRSTVNAHAHANISAQGIDDHHARDHILSGPVNHIGEISDTQHGVRAVALAHAHSAMSGIGTGDHHSQSHSAASHSDQGATGAELETLTDGSGNVTLHTHVANPVEATKAQMEAETAGVLYVPPDLFRNAPSAPKAWCRITAAGVLESPDYNVASVTDTATGERIIVWDVDFSGPVYICAGTTAEIEDAGTGDVMEYGTFAVGSVVHFIGNSGNMAIHIDKSTSTVAMGDQ